MTSHNLRNKYAPSPERGSDWRDSAACLTADPELFFPTGPLSRGPGLEQQDKAKRVCGRCAVQDVCLVYALETNQDSGVWGGLGEDERRALKRRAIRERRVGNSALERS